MVMIPAKTHNEIKIPKTSTKNKKALRGSKGTKINYFKTIITKIKFKE